jgi:hypothetical protein
MVHFDGQTYCLTATDNRSPSEVSTESKLVSEGLPDPDSIR